MPNEAKKLLREMRRSIHASDQMSTRALRLVQILENLDRRIVRLEHKEDRYEHEE